MENESVLERMGAKNTGNGIKASQKAITKTEKVLYELTGIRTESMHIQPYADMIDKLTYVQKADFC